MQVRQSCQLAVAMVISEECSVVVGFVTALMIMATRWDRKRMRQERMSWFVLILKKIVNLIKGRTLINVHECVYVW